MKYKYLITLSELVEQAQSEGDKEVSLELLYLYFKGHLIKGSMRHNSFDSDLFAHLTVVFIKACTLYKSN